jgi:hypothetical protein
MCLRFVVVRSGRSWGRMLYSGPTCKEMNDKSVKRNQKTLRREPACPRGLHNSLCKRKKPGGALLIHTGVEPVTLALLGPRSNQLS